MFPALPCVTRTPTSPVDAQNSKGINVTQDFTTSERKLIERGFVVLRQIVESDSKADRWLDEAKLLGLSPLRLIHGKGTGLLGRGLQQYLRDRDDVAAVRYGNADEGGSGVTVLELH